MMRLNLCRSRRLPTLYNANKRKRCYSILQGLRVNRPDLKHLDSQEYEDIYLSI